jgi:murein L,D-transpeptidase YcbB/YkuD
MRSAAAAAFALLFIPAAAPAQSFRSPPPAVATGLAIPIAGLPQNAPQIPARGRFVLVDAASARLFMIENGQLVDSMKVIVGKPATATPQLRSTIYYATLNPYWNVPVDLARTIIAPHVLKEGLSYLRERGYEVVSGFKRNAEVLPPETIDWQAVADGTASAYVRQRPGPANSMGRMKFAFANNDGIFLHDTPKKELFAQDQRELSNGCVRLEDAPRFARWLLGRDAEVSSDAPEQFVPLPGAVPIVITYLDKLLPVHMAALESGSSD